MQSEKLTVTAGGREFQVTVNPNGNENTVLIDGVEVQIHLERIVGDTESLIVEGKSYLFNIGPDDDGYTMRWYGGETHCVVEDEHTRLLKQFAGTGSGGSGLKNVKAPMPGLVVKILTSPGSEVEKGDPLVVVEAMKMENEIGASAKGVVKEIKVNEKQAVEKGEIMIVLEG